MLNVKKNYKEYKNNNNNNEMILKLVYQTNNTVILQINK